MTHITSIMLAAGLLGCGFGDRAARVQIASLCCDTCGVASSEVAALIQTLQCHARWRTRDNAAHDLRKYDWRCHPEILSALATAMLTDCEDEVREEAAESLAKIRPAPCDAEIHAALARAADCDPDHATRKWARRGLANLSERCSSPCDVCELSPTTHHAVARPQPLLGRFLLPRNGGFLAPGARVQMPIVTDPRPVFVDEPPIETYTIPSEPDLIPAPPIDNSVPFDPLESLPRYETLPDPSLPHAISPEPRNRPPAASNPSPFGAPRQAESSPAARFASAERAEAPKARTTPDHETPRRKTFLGRMLGR